MSQKLIKQDPEVLDRLFFTGIPIHDRIIKERFRKLWFEVPLIGRPRQPYGDDSLANHSETALPPITSEPAGSSSGASEATKIEKVTKVAAKAKATTIEQAPTLEVPYKHT